MTEEPYHDHYAYQSPILTWQERARIVAVIGSIVAVMVLLYIYVPSDSPLFVFIQAVQAVLAILIAAFQLKRIFDPAVKQANDAQYYAEAENLTSNRVWAIGLFLGSIGLAYFIIRQIVTEGTYTHPWFFAAPAILLMLAGRQMRAEEKDQAAFDKEWGIEGRTAHDSIIARPNIWKTIGTALIVAGITNAAFGLYRLWSAAA